tara:strand:- start:3244 stop:4038 length:795 start_codon:yes stop_codon:yes gene_type:complete
MRLCAIITLILSLQTHAADQFNITGFTGEYNAPNGQGSADTFNIPKQDKRKIDITLEAKGEGYLLSTPEDTWEWSEPAAWVKDLKTASWNGVDLVVGDQSQRVAISSLLGLHEDKRVHIEGLSAQCSGSNDLIQSCLNGSASIRLSKLVYQSALRSDQFQTILDALARALDVTGRGGDTEVKSLKLDISNNKFKGEVSVSIGISATVKFEGLISQDASDGKISIRLDKAKASFLDVRGKIFDELEEAQSETFIVQRPWIYILSE